VHFLAILDFGAGFDLASEMDDKSGEATSATYPKSGPYDVAHKCRLLDVEQIDQAGAIFHTHCEYKQGNKTSALVIQISGYDILITNAENY
jgi:hypothetical protein